MNCKISPERSINQSFSSRDSNPLLKRINRDGTIHDSMNDDDVFAQLHEKVQTVRDDDNFSAAMNSDNDDVFYSCHNDDVDYGNTYDYLPSHLVYSRISEMDG